MSIETECPGCGRQLRVSVEHAGRQARCPVCSTIYTVPGDLEPIGATGAGGQPGTLDDGWSMRTPEGQVFGPVDKTELDRWVTEGRVTADCDLSAPTLGGWQSADVLYPVLAVAPAARQTHAAPQSRYRYTASHRGVLVLLLGILGWLGFCPLFGVMAWIMGSSDLRDIRAGRMDPSGRGLTQAGMILGMIQSMILIGGIMVLIFVMLARVAMR